MVPPAGIEPSSLRLYADDFRSGAVLLEAAPQHGCDVIRSAHSPRRIVERQRRLGSCAVERPWWECPVLTCKDPGGYVPRREAAGAFGFRRLLTFSELAFPRRRCSGRCLSRTGRAGGLVVRQGGGGARREHQTADDPSPLPRPGDRRAWSSRHQLLPIGSVGAPSNA
jgi:hypothetical protein